MWDTMSELTRSHGGAFDARAEGIKMNHEEGKGRLKIQFTARCSSAWR